MDGSDDDYSEGAWDDEAPAVQAPAERLDEKLKRAFQDHNYRLAVIIIEELIAAAIEEHEALHHAAK